MASFFIHHDDHFTHTGVRPLTITDKLEDVTCSTCRTYAEKVEGERKSAEAVDFFNNMALEMEAAGC